MYISLTMKWSYQKKIYSKQDDKKVHIHMHSNSKRERKMMMIKRQTKSKQVYSNKCVKMGEKTVRNRERERDTQRVCVEMHS